MDSASFTIDFDNPQARYFAGQTVTGRVKLTTTSDIDCCGVQVRHQGQAHTSLTVFNGRSVITCDGARYYFNVGNYVVGNGSDIIQLPAGIHTYPFNITLDPRLPSSFTGDHGQVEYCVHAIIKMPDTRENVEFKHNFDVLARVDLNALESAHLPTEINKTYRLGILGYPSGTVTCRVSILKSGYFPGETFPVECSLMNPSRSYINRVELSIIKKVRYLAEDEVASSGNIPLTMTDGPGVAPGDSILWIRELTIPEDTPVTNLGNCELIKVNYFLKVKIVISGPHINTKKYIPIIVGSIERYEDSLVEGLPQYSGFAPTQTTRDEPPPTYWEVVPPN